MATLLRKPSRLEDMQRGKVLRRRAAHPNAPGLLSSGLLLRQETHGLQEWSLSQLQAAGSL